MPGPRGGASSLWQRGSLGSTPFRLLELVALLDALPRGLHRPFRYPPPTFRFFRVFEFSKVNRPRDCQLLTAAIKESSQLTRQRKAPLCWRRLQLLIEEKPPNLLVGIFGDSHSTTFSHPGQNQTQKAQSPMDKTLS